MLYRFVKEYDTANFGVRIEKDPEQCPYCKQARTQNQVGDRCHFGLCRALLEGIYEDDAEIPEYVRP